jgi:hypothetical protein
MDIAMEHKPYRAHRFYLLQPQPDSLLKLDHLLGFLPVLHAGDLPPHLQPLNLNLLALMEHLVDGNRISRYQPTLSFYCVGHIPPRKEFL